MLTEIQSKGKREAEKYLVHKRLKETRKKLHKLKLTTCFTQSQVEKPLYQLACMQFSFLVSVVLHKQTHLPLEVAVSLHTLGS